MLTLVSLWKLRVSFSDFPRRLFFRLVTMFGM